MNVVYSLKSATAVEIHERIPDAPSLTAVRTMLRILEDKGQLRHVKEGPRHIYSPRHARASAQRSATAHLLRTFFGGSPTAAIATLLDSAEQPLSASERAELIRLIKKSRARNK
jgi:BlaI family transcriptional regulator, penicillinase repressor